MSYINTAWLDNEFKAVRDDFVKNVKNPGKHDFTKFATIEDVWDATEEIQKKQSQTKTLRGLHRVRPFLEALNQFSSTIEVFVQAKPDILALIWGPVKFLLQVSSSISSVFEKVIKVLNEVGNTLPVFNDYASLFKENQTVKHVLHLFYAEILEFYKILVNFMNDRRFATALAQFNPPKYHTKLAEILQRSSIESGCWLDTNENYSRWARTKDPQCRCLWLQGIPGSGKTFLTANTIRRMQQHSSGQVVFLFLTNDDQSQGRILEVFTSILFQAARNDEALKSTLLEEIKSDRSNLSSNIAIRKITLDLLSSSGSISIIIDGLDEIEEYLRKPLLEALLELSESSHNIKLLLSSRAERDIAKALRDRAVSIRVDFHNHEDIKRFIDLEGKSWIDDLKDFEAEEAMFTAAQEGLVHVHRKSAGMFLYTKLILQLLMVQGTAADIQAELESLPDGLDQAYDRILTRINTQLLPTQRVLARKVLGWISCALRPVRKEELLQILVVEPGETEFRKGRRFNTDIGSACGPIIEIVDDIVRFVHFSAKEYITDKRTGFLDMEKAALDAAVTCSSYLCHNSLDVLFDARSSSVGAIQQRILDKDFVFFDYAANMWLQHVSVIKTGLSLAESGLNEILSKLFKARDGNSAEKLNPPGLMLERFNLFRDVGDLQKMLAYSYKIQGQLKYGQFVEDVTVSGSMAFRLFLALQSFRTHIEDLYCGSSTHLDGCYCPEPLRTYGPPAFFCEKPFCYMYKRGYPTRLSRDRHMVTHQRDYKCPHPDCFHFEQGFHTQAALNSHQKAVHQQDGMRPHHTNTGTLSSTVLADLCDDDLALVLKDAIIHSTLDTIRDLLGLRPGLTEVMKVDSLNSKQLSVTRPFDYCLCLAAWKSNTEVLSFLVDQSTSGCSQDQRLLQALATAIETKNRSNIKYLLSFSPSLTQEPYLPRHFEKAILDKQRSNPPGTGSFYIATDIVSRALSLWDPDLMEFLITECDFVIPRVPRARGGLFSRPAIKGLNLEEVRGRFEQMRKYVTDPRAFYDGICRAVTSWSPSALRICLENGGSPDAELDRLGAADNNILVHANSYYDRVAKEMVRLLLEHGANPVIKATETFEYHNGISWYDFVQKARSGEDLDMIIPKKGRKKV
ncbi:hypothetical protein N8I77_008413 [Diaporthe amygdali]|uniref:NACHT domain-containing protein n=1 Tax=Phomopsis amygdali TaxID=1214568 RepID=A0AAD9W4F6_PHOAM|nr:hypothetical protein N8I77_008413 [Diaporthe amygdali]